MCHYITLVVRGDASGVAAAMQKHGRRAGPMENPSIGKVLAAGEFQFLTTAGHCDCGTVLGRAPPSTPDLEAQAARLRRKGWSEAKIARAVADSQKTVRPAGDAPDSLELWAAIVRDVSALSGVRGVGLLVHGYSGAISDEVFGISRRDVVSADIAAALDGMREDELLFLKA